MANDASRTPALERGDRQRADPSCILSIHVLTCLDMSARYRELATELQAAVDAGTYPPGSRLPSESEVAQAYGVARGTVRQAFAVLAADGLISTRKGTRR